MADYKTRQFFGTAQTIFNWAIDIAAGNFSSSGSVFDNTVDAVVPYATHAVAMLQMPDWGGAPAAGTVIELWGVMQDVDDTADETDEPSGTTVGGAHFIGAWVVSGVDALQRREIVISLEGIRKVKLFLKNGTAVNLNNDGGTNMVLKITPFCYGVST